MKEHWRHLTPSNAPQVVIFWRDIREISAWEEGEEEDIRPARKLETIGWLLYTGPDPKEPNVNVTVIAKSYDHETSKWADYTVFPETVVRTIKHGERQHGQTNPQ